MESIMDEIHNYGQTRLFLSAEYSEVSDSRDQSTLFEFYVRRDKYCDSSSSSSGHVHTKRMSKKENNFSIEVPAFSLYQKESLYVISQLISRVDRIDHPFAESAKRLIYTFHQKVSKLFRRVGISTGMMVVTAHLSINEVIREEEALQSCAICLENFDSALDIHKTPCHHLFHRKCISEWRRHMKTCPLCRFKF